MALIPCARCHKKKRTVLFEILVPVTVCINYHTKEYRDFPATTLFCGNCLHCLDRFYGGRSEHLLMNRGTIQHAYIRADGTPVTRAIVPGSTETPPFMK